MAAQTLISINILDSVYASHSDLVSSQGRYRTSQYILIIEESIKFSRYAKVFQLNDDFARKIIKIPVPTRLLQHGQNNIAPCMLTGNYSYLHWRVAGKGDNNVKKVLPFVHRSVPVHINKLTYITITKHKSDIFAYDYEKSNKMCNIPMTYCTSLCNNNDIDIDNFIHSRHV